MKRLSLPTGMAVVLCTAVLAVALVGAALAEPTPPDATVANKINYQGRLTNPSGLPLDGTYPMRFQVYDDAAVGTLLWDSGVFNVAVDNGLFNAVLSVDAADFDGQALWLRLYVNGEWLTPRQELVPVPYALSLRPGAQVSGEPTAWTGWVFNVTMEGAYPQAGAVTGVAATGSAVRGESDGGLGVYGYTEDGYAVYGLDTGTSPARGYGGYFSSDNGIGVFGYSAANRTAANNLAPGIYGRSLQGVGVYGVSESTYAGVRGESTDGPGVYGRSTNGHGVSGSTSSDDIGDAGVYGVATSAYGVYGFQSGTASGLGTYGRTDGYGSGASGVSYSTGNGTWGYSSEGDGVNASTARADNNYGVYTPDNLYSLNFHLLGATMQVVQNGDSVPLEQGDVVVIAGLGESPVDGVPLLHVRRASEANSTGVIGVVYSTYAPAWLEDPAARDPTGATGRAEAVPAAQPGPVAPGEYLLIVVRGPCLVKANADTAALEVGDLLASTALPGVAGRAAEITVDGTQLAAPGTVVGKALAPLATGQKLLYVYVTLQ